jgi:Papain family cysteine protease
MSMYSEQQITDCTYTYDGCLGGDHHDAWTSIYKRGGQEPISAYPFVSGSSGKATKCAFVASKVAAKLANAGTDIPQDETAIQAALVAKGPITFAYYVSNKFYSYR